MLPSPVPSFPKYRGPFQVGSAEYEIPIADLPSPLSAPDVDISTLKFRCFYPTIASAKPHQTIWWVPEPQREWLDAFATFLGASPRLASLFSYLPNFIKYTRIPAVANAPLRPAGGPGEKYPVLIFSHGLGGTCNTYSALLGSLASYGVICFAPEHRDRSSPMTIIRQKDKATIKRSYLNMSHDPSVATVNARNAQLRIRLWELECLYSALQHLNSPKPSSLTNLAATNPGITIPSFSSALDLSPSSVTWAGHSFGAATTVQFIKSVFWNQSAPSLKGTKHENDANWQPLYTTGQSSLLIDQISPRSPVVLLDLWTMPLRGDTTRWLWEKPLPCYAQHSDSRDVGCNVMAVMSEAFYRDTDIRERTKAVLSKEPTKGTQDHLPEGQGSCLPRLFWAPKTAHLSHSDFGILFPRITKRFLKAEEPERTIELNVRAILQLFRERSVGVEAVTGNHGNDPEILSSKGQVPGWRTLPIKSARKL